MLRSLRTQIFLWTILPLAIVLIVLAFLGVSSHQAAMRELVAERDAALARVSAARISELLADHSRELMSLNASETETWNTTAFDGGIALFDPHGELVQAVPSRAVWQARPSAPREEGFSLPYFENGAWLVFITRRVNDQFLIGAFTLPSFSTIAPRGIAYIVDGQGRIIAHPNPAQGGTDLSTHAGIVQVTRGETGATFHHDLNGTELVVGYARLPRRAGAC